MTAETSSPMSLVRRIALPVLATVIVLELITRLWVAVVDPQQTTWYDASVQARIEQIADRDDIDVVFAGTSMAWQAFVPGVFDANDPDGRTSYNLGIDGGIPQVTGPWLVEHVAPTVKPQLVVWGLSPLDFVENFGEGAVDRWQSAIETRRGLMGSVDRAASRVSAMIEWRRVLRDPAEWSGGDTDDDIDRFAAITGEGGERRDFEIIKTDTRFRILQARLKSDNLDADDAQAFTSAVAALKQQGIDVQAVLLPVPPAFVGALPGGAADLQNRLAQITELVSGAGVVVTDLSTGFGDDDFVDFTHLTEPAAAEFTRAFATRTPPVPPVGVVPGTGTGVIPDDTCGIELQEDEYGFEVEVDTCIEGGAAPLATTDAETGSAEATKIDPASVSAGDADLSTIDVLIENFVTRECHEPIESTLGTESTLTPELRNALEAAFTELISTSSECASNPGPTLGVVERLESAAGLAPTGRSAPNERASRLIAAIDALSVLIDERSANVVNPAVYYGDQLLVRTGLEQRSDQGAPPSTVVIGSSSAQTAIDQAALAARLDGNVPGTTSVMNLAIPSSDAEEWLVLWDQLLEDLEPPERVIWAFTTHRMIDTPITDCTTLRRSPARRTVVFRDEMFPGLQQDYRPWELILGGLDPDAPIRRSPSWLAADERHEAPGLTYRVDPDEFRYSGVPSSERRYPNGVFCEQRIDLMDEVAEMIEADGAELIFALLPVHGDVIAAGEDNHRRAREALEDLASRSGRRLIDLGPNLTDGETWDGWHTLAPGRDRVTASLGEALTPS